MKRNSIYTHFKWLAVLAALVLLAGCKATAPVASPKLWDNVDTVQQTVDSTMIDGNGNTWQGSSSDSLRLVDASGTEQWRLSLDSSIINILQAPYGAVVLTKDNAIRGVSPTGTVLWLQTTLPGIPSTAGVPWLTINSQGEVRAILGDKVTVHAVALNSDGSLAWQKDLDATEFPWGNSIGMAELADGNTLLLQGVSPTQYQAIVISPDGVASQPTAFMSPMQSMKLQVSGNNIIVVDGAAVYGLNADGSPAWQYNPDSYTTYAGSVRCSQPTDNGLVCAFQPKDTPTSTQVDWIANDGTITQSKVYNLPNINNVTRTDNDQWLLWQMTSPSQARKKFCYPFALAGITCTGYFTDQLYLLGSNGNILKKIVLPPRQDSLQIYVNSEFGRAVGIWATSAWPTETHLRVAGRQNQVIVSGFITKEQNDVITPFPSYPQVSAYAQN